MNAQEILARIKELSNPDSVAGMARYGINPEFAYGVSIPNLRSIAKKVGKDPQLALDLWASRVHEARILATMLVDPDRISDEQMEQWVADFNSWDLCDQCCNNLFRKTSGAHEKAVEWTERQEQFVKRAGFVLIACLAVHDKRSEDQRFIDYFPIIARESSDPRNFVKKAVNWALRQIGKRNRNLNRHAIEWAEKIRETDSKPARWIASDALKELTSEKTRSRFEEA